MYSYRGKTALVTGASSGIGEAFARELAARGMQVILVARSAEKLRALAAELTDRYDVRAEAIPADLSRDGAPQALYDETRRRGLAVDLLVNNAGFGAYGDFEAQEMAHDHEQVMLNITAVVDLTHLFIPTLIERGGGGVINIASTAAFQPVPYMPVYGASKSFVVTFSEALWSEYRRKGVRVLALCPGPTRTAFFRVADNGQMQLGRLAQTPEQVVLNGLRGLERGRALVISGVGNAIFAGLASLLPGTVVSYLGERVLRQRTSQPAGAPLANPLRQDMPAPTH